MDVNGRSLSGDIAALASPGGQAAALTAAVALVEVITPVQVVLAYLYVLPLILLSETARPRTIWSFVALTCGLTLSNLVIPEFTPISGSVLMNRLLVCGALVLTARQCLRIQGLQRQRLHLEGQLAVEDLRRDFVATLAHDLKTPILGTIATLRSLSSSRQSREGPLLERTLATIERGQSRALAQIQTLLEVYRNDAEGLVLQSVEVEFTRLVEEVIRELSALAQERQLTLRLGFGEASQWHPHLLIGDGAQLRRLVENLLLNAIHHSLRGGQIQLVLENRSNGLQLRVADGGPGVPEQEISKLFQRFQRLSEERPGSGLGLYLCRQIVNAHGGTIGLRNRPGGGAEIEVLLPQGSAEPPPEGG
ncbi:HAMP domain-containing histidine kinase [Synechococcus sp. Tobar12-5m-g]|uniref:sensor histidine kinase n=1 Tax=Synechococcus sp. Tobar12-5m-g TaxID=2823742 RepID=UPI0020CDD545|nr:HAMP domain-containing sensor histidine kinase [Synechococcus sp. Tobar12-5m-g]MCP9773509.1 HAMP domain-containing histidine kinase [Synechococcus sp. Tobar12-5m-g]